MYLLQIERRSKALFLKVSQDKNIAQQLNSIKEITMNYWLQYLQKKNLTYSDLGDIHYGQVRDTVQI